MIHHYNRESALFLYIIDNLHNTIQRIQKRKRYIKNANAGYSTENFLLYLLLSQRIGEEKNKR